jgi:enterochelin esterase-like enzyme
MLLQYYSGWTQPQLHASNPPPAWSVQGKGRSDSEKIYQTTLEPGTSFYLTYKEETDRPDWGSVYTMPSFPCALVDGAFYPLPYAYEKPSVLREEWTLSSRFFKQPFHLRFYAPRFSRQTRPLLLLNDGQNQWKDQGYAGGWHSDWIAEKLLRQGKVAPFYLLAIDHPLQRDQTYLPSKKASRYLSFLVEELLPYLHQRFALHPQIRFAGSSYGGINALYAGLHYPEIFTQIACLSYAYYFADPLPALLKQKPLPLQKLYLSAGTRWTEDPQDLRDDHQDLTQSLYETIQQKNPHLNIKFHLFPGYAHSEKYWRLQVPDFLSFFFPV